MKEKYTVKDINELKKEISLGKKIKITGRRIIRLPKIMLQKIKNWYKEKKEKLYTYVADEAEQERDRLNSKIDNKLENKNEKIFKKQKIYDNYKNDEAFQKEGSLENDYLNALGDQIKSIDSKRAKLKDKSIKVSSKSFGLFKTSRLALNKFAKAKWSAVQEKIDKRKQEREEQKKQKLDAQKEISMMNDWNEMQKIYDKLQKKASRFKEKYGISLEEFFEKLSNQNAEEETRSVPRH